ncbi:TlpA disulfide reductase family protein [Ancylomarina sp. 16SWW S1-10-2]|uniref:TlpA disulfide reductase family protein n=1 Tax=Ancylomarina sp. 16SWW S1-10-2 TaxID=2499681 RepID=UPI0012AE4775|nr:TlpA disulfide reductase family protein [Ancylomarina sp. 16SWW S1-10-2]MRT94711.1 AhpC/TSA family protein [Ancylomarina sp. 16SWW S1-10-2]
MKFSKLFAFMALVTLFSCSKVTDKCIIKGQLSGGDGDVVVYPYQEVQSMEESDSLSYKAKIVDGKFELELDTELACRSMDIRMGKEFKRYSLFSEPGVITITEKEGELVGEGSALNDEYHEFLNKLNYKAYNKLKYNKTLSAEEQAIVDNYNSTLWSLSKDYSTSIPLSRLFYEKYWSADVDTFNMIIKAFSKDIHASYYIQKMISRRDNQQRVAIGKQAPLFTLKSVDGEDISLEGYRGKYLLVDFWASWCGPCRAGIPNLKEIYKDYKAQGLEILSVSTDTDEKAWLKAVEKEQMPWNQVRDTKSISDSYNITYIPMIFLIDPNGKIIDKGLHGEAIRNRVEEVIAKK